MNNDNSLQFELNLVDKYMTNPNPELAEVLIKEFSFHKINHTEPSLELSQWIIERSKAALKNHNKTASIFGLTGVGARPAIHLKYISMNVYCWMSILDNSDHQHAFNNTARLFGTDSDSVKIAFERKNHDFGERELCRVGLDLCIAIHDIEITSHHREIVLATLNEEIDIQMMKDFTHHRAMYDNFK